MAAAAAVDGHRSPHSLLIIENLCGKSRGEISMYEKEMKKLMKLYEDGIFSQPFYADKIAGRRILKVMKIFQKFRLCTRMI